MTDLDSIREFVESRISDMNKHVEQAGKIENELMDYLWSIHKQRLVSVGRMAKWLGTSRQTMYNKWATMGKI